MQGASALARMGQGVQEGLGGAEAPVQAPALPLRVDTGLNGVWVKDTEASDPMATACDIM